MNVPNGFVLVRSHMLFKPRIVHNGFIQETRNKVLRINHNGLVVDAEERRPPLQLQSERNRLIRKKPSGRPLLNEFFDQFQQGMPNTGDLVP